MHLLEDLENDNMLVCCVQLLYFNLAMWLVAMVVCCLCALMLVEIGMVCCLVWG